MLGLIECVVLALGCRNGAESTIREAGFLGMPPVSATAVLFAPGIISTGAHELDFTMTPDGLEVFFTRAGPDWTSTILTLRRDGNGWSGPAIASFTGGHEAIYPFVAPDGKRVYFEYSSVIAEFGQETENSNLYVSERVGDDWSPGHPLGRTINTEGTEMFAGAASNGNLYFSANYQSSLGGFDVFRSMLTEEGYEQPRNLGAAVNSKANEFHAFIASDESFILFDSDRPGGFGGNDLFISFRDDTGGWSPAVNLGNRVNTQASESRPFVSPDGRYLFFSSNRTVSPTNGARRFSSFEEFTNRIDGPGNGNQDIYWMDAGIIKALRTSMGLAPD